MQKVEVSFGVASGLFSKGYKVRIEKGDTPLFGKPNNTAKKGEITESIILSKLIQLGYECLIPWGHDHRSDIAIDDDGKLKGKDRREKPTILEYILLIQVKCT